MGNNKRSDSNEARANAIAQRRQAELEQKKKEKRQGVILLVCVILVALLMIGVITYSKISDSGYFLRRSVAAETENYTVDGAMLTYFFYNNYQQYASLASYLGIDTSQSLKAQAASFGTGTWFDYFMTMTRNSVNEILAVCEAAKAAGVSLDDDDQSSIDATIDTLRETAKSHGYTISQYFVTTLGANLKEKDVRNCLELTTLASKYATQFTDSLTYTEEQCETYYSENKDSFDGVDFLTYTLSPEDFASEEGEEGGDDTEGTETDETSGEETETDANTAAMQDYADRLAAASGTDEFSDIVKEYRMEVLGEDEETAQTYCDGSLTVTHALKTDASVTNVADWAFSASAGDTTSSTDEESGDISVYFLTKAPYRDETTTRNVRHILLNVNSYDSEEACQTAAEAVYAEWESAGFTLDKFLELNEQYNEDSSVTNGGLYENVAPGDMVTEFNDWLFDEARVPGDHGLISTSYGWHLMYYEGESDETVWQADAENALSSADYDALVEQYGAGTTFYDDVLNSIRA